jgi:hypothetical protein
MEGVVQRAPLAPAVSLQIGGLLETIHRPEAEPGDGPDPGRKPDQLAQDGRPVAAAARLVARAAHLRRRVLRPRRQHLRCRVG